MIARHTLTYVGSRVVAAVLNMASLAAFTRLAPVETYGSYLFVLSWAIVLYAATCQWPRMAMFALYEEARAPAQVGTVFRLILGFLALAALGAGGAVALGLTDARIAACIVAATFGMAVSEVVVEVARARLAAEAVGLSVVLRGLLTLALGSLALRLTQDPLSLVLAVVLAYLLACLPAAYAIRALLREASGSAAEARRLVAYGWPLILSLGLASLAQTIDRLIIGRTIGPEELGAYGAIGDLLRQSFVVFGEGIALSFIAIAKREAREHGMDTARPVLRQAALALAFVGAFGAVFFLDFDELIVSILLGAQFREAALSLVPIFVAASVATMFRAYYFGQVIFFATSSLLEAFASGTMLVAVAGLSVVLIPVRGVEGAAIALAVGQVLACLVFVLGARWQGGGRASEAVRMPLPLPEIAWIALSALATYAALVAIGSAPGAAGPAGTALRLALLALAAAATAWRFDIAGIAQVLGRRSRRAA